MLPPLRTTANRIVRADSLEPALLCGVNRSGLEYNQPRDTGITEDEIRTIVQDWRANVIRLPFNQTWALADEAYVDFLDQVVAWAAGLGAYTILDLQWLDTETKIPHTPDADSIRLWRNLATRYRDNPAVLFDLLNEPHDRAKDDPNPVRLANLTTTKRRRVDAKVWNPWAQHLTNEIRDAGFEGLILIGGTDWGFDLTDIEVEGPNLVYSTHIYPNRPQSDWPKSLGRAAEVPVFVGEWGGEEKDLPWGRVLAATMRGLVAGWTAWSWADYPHLMREGTPTPFGALVRQELSRCDL